MDYVGPLPRTSNGNVYILVFVGYFSKWIEVSAVREATAQVAANKFISDIFARHSAPSYLISDRGTPFVSDLFEHVVSTLGTHHRLTTAYHPQTNATERVNRTLKTAIRAYVGDKHTTWDKIYFTLLTAPHESTGLSSSMMLYGRELETPLDLVTQPTWDRVDDPGVPYPESLRASLQETHDHAQAVLAYEPEELLRPETSSRLLQGWRPCQSEVTPQVGRTNKLYGQAGPTVHWSLSHLQKDV